MTIRMPARPTDPGLKPHTPMIAEVTAPNQITLHFRGVPPNDNYSTVLHPAGLIVVARKLSDGTPTVMTSNALVEGTRLVLTFLDAVDPALPLQLLSRINTMGGGFAFFDRMAPT